MDDSRFSYFSSHATPHIASFIGLSYCIYKLHTIQSHVNELLSSQASSSAPTTPLRSQQQEQSSSTTADSCGWWPVCKGGKAES